MLEIQNKTDHSLNYEIFLTKCLCNKCKKNKCHQEQQSSNILSLVFIEKEVTDVKKTKKQHSQVQRKLM